MTSEGQSSGVGPTESSIVSPDMSGETIHPLAMNKAEKILRGSLQEPQRPGEDDNPVPFWGEDPEADAIPDDAKRRAKLMEMSGNKDFPAQDLLGIMNAAQVPEEGRESLLKNLGQDPEKISKVMEGPHLAPGLTDEDRANPTDPKSTPAEMEEITAELQAVLNKKERGEKLDAHDEKTVNGAKEWLKKKLFDDESGLLREQDRFKRLFIKPAVIAIFAAIISYMIILNAVTKGTTARVGK